MFQVQCLHCTQTIQCAPEWVGRLISCPACQTQLQLPASPVQHHQPNLTDSPPASRQTKKQVLKSQMLSAAFSDPEIYKKILQSKGFIIGAFSLLGIVLVIVIINFSLGVAQQAARALPTDIPIPDFLEPDPDPPADIIGVTLLLDENDKYAIFKFTDNQNRSVFKWFDEELAKRDWVYVKSQFDSRVWRKENRRLVVFAPGSGERQVVTIHEVPDFEWDENQFQEAVVLKPDEDKFKSWLLAVSSYHYEQKMFPFDKHVSGEDTDSGFSWAVHLLPYIGKRELYDTFDMKGDYKSPQNSALGKELIKELVLNSGQIKWVHASLVPETFKSLYEMDGASNTVCFVQSKKIDDGPWTKPASIKPAEVIEEFKALQDGESMIFGMYDGSVRRITNEYDLSDIEAVLEPADRKLPKNLSQ